MAHFLTVQLDQDRFGEVLPLVRIAIPGVDEQRWFAHCHQMIRLGGGVLAAATEDFSLHGVASWRPEEDLRLGRVLRVEMLVALELSHANPVRTTLCDALEALCASHDAVGVALSLPIRDRDGQPTSFPETWRRAGFRRQALFMCKPVGPARADRPAPFRGGRLRLIDADDRTA
jgi:hypothetical protein